MVCDFNFEKVYGSIGYQFIHVHHLNPMATNKQENKVNPIDDLRPVCPNCHSMLHKDNPPLTIEELKAKLGNDRVVMALSGGVDSSVAAILVHRAIGKNLYCIFVDNGLLRKDEYQNVLDSYHHIGLNIKFDEPFFDE